MLRPRVSRSRVTYSASSRLAVCARVVRALGWITFSHSSLASASTNFAQADDLAEEAIRDGDPLPDDPDGRLVALTTPYKTNLGMLRAAFGLARRDGVSGMKTPAGMALVASDMHRGYERWSEEEFLARTGVERQGVMKRAGILGVGNHVT
jgi:hypothetical protein